MTPQELRKSILLLAFKGKLVNQNKEETSSSLLFDVQKNGFANKKYLCFTDELAPYDIPENWSWCMFHNVVSLENGAKQKGIKLPYLEAKYLRGNTDAKYLESGEIIEPGTKVILVDGENSGEVFFIREKGYMGSTFKVLNIYNSLDEKYVLYFMKLHQDDYRNNKKGAAIPHLNKNVFFEMPFPLPPLQEQKRIVAKIEELLPLVDRYEEAWNKLESFNKKFPLDMEKSLLHYATKGKLVNQDPAEGTGKELLDKIIELRNKELPSKKQIVLKIDNDENPFDIPLSWTWCKISDIAEVKGGKRIPAGRKLTNENTGHVYIRVSDMKNNSVNMNNLMYVPNDIYPTISRYIINKEDIYITVAGTIGAVGCIPDELDGANLTENADRLVFNNIDKKWLIYCLSSDVVQQQIRDATTKVGQPKLAILRIENIRIPLPPFEEQKRIVAKLKELLPLCRKLINNDQ